MLNGKDQMTADMTGWNSAELTEHDSPVAGSREGQGNRGKETVNSHRA